MDGGHGGSFHVAPTNFENTHGTICLGRLGHVLDGIPAPTDQSSPRFAQVRGLDQAPDVWLREDTKAFDSAGTDGRIFYARSGMVF